MQLLVFVAATLMVIAGAVGVIARNRAVHAALSLVLTLFGVAVLFVSMEASTVPRTSTSSRYRFSVPSRRSSGSPSSLC